MHTCFCKLQDCILCEARLPTTLSSDQVCRIRGLLTIRNIGPREILFREGDASHYLYLLRDGHMKLTASGADGREQIIGLGVSGNVVGFDTVHDKAYAYTAKTLTPVVVCQIRHHDMIRILDENPRVSRLVVKLLNTELARAKKLIRVLGMKTSAEKVAAFITSLIPGTMGGHESDEIHLPLSRQEIADMLGITVETVSRHMAVLKREGIIDAPRNRIQILDRERLRQVAGGTGPVAVPRNA